MIDAYRAGILVGVGEALRLIVVGKELVVSVGIIGVVALEAAGGDMYFSEPGINIRDFFKTGLDGRGMINVLDARKLVKDQTLYSAFLLYLLSELFEKQTERCFRWNSIQRSRYRFYGLHILTTTIFV